MNGNRKIKVGLIGTGFMAQNISHALKQLPSFYAEISPIELNVVASQERERAQTFAKDYQFNKGVSIEDFWQEDFNYLIITSSNRFHFTQLKTGLLRPQIEKIYCEKPLVVSKEEAEYLENLPDSLAKKIHVGFQFNQIWALQKAREFFPLIGKPVHFEANYLRSGYLDYSYREKKRERLLDAPIGGVTADLGSHTFSILVSFLGYDLTVESAMTAGGFSDVSIKSDLHTEILVKDQQSLAIGTIKASRISSGNLDEISLSIYGDKGSFKYSSGQSDDLLLFQKEKGAWEKFSPKVPIEHARSLREALYLFFLDRPKRGEFYASLKHGLKVQDLIFKTIELL